MSGPATPERSLTGALAGFASETSFDDLPDELVETLKLATLNILACCLGGSQTRIGRMHVELARELGGGGAGQATILGQGARVSLPFAVYANGNLAFALDYEDMLFAVAHPGFAAVSASLALSEQRQLSGREFLAALAVGYESTARIALTMQPSHARARRVWGQQFHPFASAGAATSILGLTAAEAEVALGIASTYATVPSVYKYFGPVRDTRPIREVKQGWGWVAMGGLMAAMSARKGFQGGLGALDGEFGFWSMAGSDRFDPGRGLDGLGETWLTREIEYKLHPSIGINHPAFWATSKLVREHALDATAVEQIAITTPWGNLLADTSPAGAVDAQFSLPYTVATALDRRPLTPRLYDEETLRDPGINRLLARTRVVHDAAADAAFYDEQRIVQEVTLTLTDGRTLTQGAEFPRDRPAIGAREIERKLHDLAGEILSTERREALIAAVRELPALEDASSLIALATP